MQAGSPERAKLRAEFIRVMLQAAAAIIVVPSAVVSLAGYRNQVEKDHRDVSLRQATAALGQGIGPVQNILHLRAGLRQPVLYNPGVVRAVFDEQNGQSLRGQLFLLLSSIT